MSQPGKSAWKEIRRWLPGVLISLVAIFVVLKLAEWEELGPALKTIRPIYIAAAVLLTLLFLGVRAIAWRVLLGGKASIAQTFWAINEGYLLNNIFPFRAGEFGRAVLLGQATGLGTMHVLSTIVIERAFDMAFAAGLLLATLPLALGMSWAKPVALITLGLVVLGLFILFLMSRYHRIVQGWLENIGKRWNFFQRFIVPQFSGLLDGLGSLTNPKQFVFSFLWIAVSWAIAVTEYWVVMLAIAPEAPFWWGAFADAVLALGIAIPSAPAALGTFEAALVGALTILNINETSALAYAITIHFMQFVTTGILGLIGLSKAGRSLGTIFSEIRLRSKTEA